MEGHSKKQDGESRVLLSPRKRIFNKPFPVTRRTLAKVKGRANSAHLPCQPGTSSGGNSGERRAVTPEGSRALPAPSSHTSKQTSDPGSWVRSAKISRIKRRASGAQGPSDARVGWASPQGHQTDQNHP